MYTCPKANYKLSPPPTLAPSTTKKNLFTPVNKQKEQTESILNKYRVSSFITTTESGDIYTLKEKSFKISTPTASLYSVKISKSLEKTKKNKKFNMPRRNKKGGKGKFFLIS